MCQGAAMARKSSDAGDGLQRAPAAPLAGEEQVGNGGADEEDGSDQALGEQWPARRRPTSSKSARGGSASKPVMQAVESDQQKEAELRLGNDEAGKEKRADGGEHGQAGVEAGARAPGAAGPEPGEPGEAEHGQRVGQVGGKDVLAEDLVEAGDDPVGQRRLLDVADAVDLGGDPVAGLGHVLRGLGVGGVHVVQQRRREERSELHGGKDGRQKQPDSQRGGRLSRANGMSAYRGSSLKMPFAIRIAAGFPRNGT